MFKDRYEKVKLHVKEHKEAYIVGAIGVTVVAGVLILKRRPIIIAAPVFNNNNLPVFNNVVNNGGHATKIVQRLSDGHIWESATEAALSLAEQRGITLDRARWLISRNINGALDAVYGDHYRAIGLSTTG